MKEKIELRIIAEVADRILPPDLGERLGTTVRKVLLHLDDPLLEKIVESQREASTRNEFVVSYWQIYRKYTQKELEVAKLFWVRLWPFFLPVGEEHGTIYDETQACPQCGVGYRQVGPLRMDLNRIPKRDIAQTLAGEIVVSAKLAEQMKAARIRGYELGPVLGRNGKESPDWYQFLWPQGTVKLSPKTRVGYSFFRPEPDETRRLEDMPGFEILSEMFKKYPPGKTRCPGHIPGFTVLSEVFVKRDSVGREDWLCSRPFFGQRFGTGRPLPLLFISQRLYRLFVRLKVKRFDVEVAHLV